MRVYRLQVVDFQRRAHHRVHICSYGSIDINTVIVSTSSDSNFHLVNIKRSFGASLIVHSGKLHLNLVDSPVNPPPESRLDLNGWRDVRVWLAPVNEFLHLLKVNNT